MEKEQPTSPETELGGAYPPEQPQGVKVYERPARRGLPVWMLLLLLVIAIALSWFAFQAIR